eukprot:gene2485-5438_t
MSKLEDQLKLLEAELKASASGQALAKHQPTLIYNTLNLQAEALKSVGTKLDYLGIQMEKLSIREPSQSHALRSKFPLVQIGNGGVTEPDQDTPFPLVRIGNGGSAEPDQDTPFPLALIGNRGSNGGVTDP